MMCNDILTYHLNASQFQHISSLLPAKSCCICKTDCFTDLIAIPTFAIIVNAADAPTKDLELLFEFYSELGDFSETVILLGSIAIPTALSKKINLFPDFDALAPNVKYLLLSAYRKKKKSETFSATLANAIIILSSIRNTPGISTAELSERLELSVRSVQRYIETLRIAGEWIEYDTYLKGWKLSVGKSVLWGDF